MPTGMIGMLGAPKDPHSHRRGRNGTRSNPNGAPAIAEVIGFEGKAHQSFELVFKLERKMSFEVTPDMQPNMKLSPC